MLWDLYFIDEEMEAQELSDFLNVTVITSGEARTGIHSRQADSVIKVSRPRQLGSKHMARGVELGPDDKGRERYLDSILLAMQCVCVWGTNDLSRRLLEKSVWHRAEGEFERKGHWGCVGEIARFFILTRGPSCSFHLDDHHLP